jgi:Carboxypeptidase regulatory-like domain
MKKFLISCGAASLLLLSGCGKSDTSEAPKKDEAPAAAATAPADDANAATVTGKVSFTGDKPAMKTISMDATPACSRQHSTAQKSQEVIVNDNGTLKNTFVWIKSGLPDKQWPVPAGSVKLEQKGCMYEPHVLGVMANQNIEVVNGDPTNHNIHPLPKVNREWNESQPPGGDAKMKTFAREEVMIPVKCNVHPWMRAYIGVVGNPFFAVTGDDGTFTIKGLPPGTYTIEAWHEKYGTQDAQITVAPKESKTNDFSFKG